MSDDTLVLEEELLERFQGMSRQELLESVRAMRRIEQRLRVSGPSNDDELHAFIKEELGIDVPRVAVCEGHQSPFDLIAAVVFDRTSRAIGMGNRGGMKTLGMAIASYVKQRFTAGMEVAHVGAVEAQSRRAYNHFTRLLDLPTSDGLVDPRQRTMGETRWKNGSRVEILAGTMNAVNGPHPPLVHADEVELMDPAVLYESYSMPKSGKTKDGVIIPSQYIITSTRKRAHGMMQKLWSECDEAVANGHKPPFDRFVWCCFECAAQVKSCCMAPENKGKPEKDLCDCKNIVNGKWKDGTPRTFATVCRGRLHRARGFMPMSDLISDFLTIPQRNWEAQMECIRASAEGLVLPQCTREAKGVHYTFDPDKGPVIMVWDPGGPNPHAVGWYQELRYQTTATDLGGNEVHLSAGTVVLFDEIYKAGIGNTKCADLVCRREEMYKEKHRNFRVSLRIVDPHTTARIDWVEHKPPLKCTFLGTHDVKEQVKIVNDFMDEDRFYADLERVPNFWNEVESWHYPDPKTDLLDDPERPVADGDHMMSTLRYGLQAFHVIRRRQRPDAKPGPRTDGLTFEERRRAALGPQLGRLVDRTAPDRTENWRPSFAPMGGMGGH